MLNLNKLNMAKNSLLKSFSFAFRGILEVLKKERNIKIHLFFAFLAVFLGIVLGIDFVSWAVVVLTIAVVLAAEIFNSSLEAVCNLLKEKLGLGYEETRFARDTAAGAVLVLAIASVLVGFLIFLPYFF